MKYIILIAFSALIFASCDEQKVEIPDYIPPDSDRVVLVEEFTGASCPNCPSGSAELRSLKQRFGSNIAIVGVHSSFLASPRENSKYDFRMIEADQLEQFLGPYLGKPSAAFNRIFFENEDYRPVANVGAWAGLVASQLEDFSLLNINAERSFNPENRNLNVSFTVEAREILDGNFTFTAYLTESGIIDPQLSQTGVIEEYEHNFVLRKILSSVSGDPLATQLAPGNPLTVSYNFTLPAEDGWWVAENCSVIGFVTRQGLEAEDLEVIQAIEIAVVE